MTLTSDQRATIVENDPKAAEKLHELHRQIQRGDVSIERAKRLRINIDGNAIDRWVKRCKQEGVSVRDAAAHLNSEPASV